MMYERRRDPRYSASLSGKAVILEAGSLETECRIVNLSRHGLRLVPNREILTPPSSADIDIALPDRKTARVSLRVLRQERIQYGRDGYTAYSGPLVFLCEQSRRLLHAFLRSNRLDVMGDRRQGDRRRGDRVLTSQSSIVSERRLRDRRKRPGIFTDCLAFANRLPNWKTTYTYYRHTEPTRPGRTIVNGRELISFASKDYLGLSHHPMVKQAVTEAVHKYGTTTWSRPLNGTIDLLRQLEDELAEFKGKETALVFTGGYVANVTIITSLLKKGDVVFLDEKVHASIVDGCIAAGVKIVVFEHNGVEDLEKKLARTRQDRSLIIVDGVYSIEGDLALLPAIKSLAVRHSVPLMVDDAHGLGVMGASGAGTSEHFGLRGDVDVEVGSFGASLAGIGGFIACDKAVKDYLVHFCDGILYTTNLPPGSVAGVLQSLRVIRQDPSIRRRLWSNVSRFKSGLRTLGYKIGPSESAVMTIEIGNERLTDDAVKMLEGEGISVNTFRRPMVRRGGAKLRMSVTAAHEESDIEKALHGFRKIKPWLDERLAGLRSGLNG